MFVYSLARPSPYLNVIAVHGEVSQFRDLEGGRFGLGKRCSMAGHAEGFMRRVGSNAMIDWESQRDAAASIIRALWAKNPFTIPALYYGALVSWR